MCARVHTVRDPERPFAKATDSATRSTRLTSSSGSEIEWTAKAASHRSGRGILPSRTSVFTARTKGGWPGTASRPAARETAGFGAMRRRLRDSRAIVEPTPQAVLSGLERKTERAALTDRSGHDRHRNASNSPDRAAPESNRPSVGLPHRTGFEDLLWWRR